MEFVLPPAVYRICRRLQKNGYACYLVGGAVRDTLLGRRCFDFDLASNASVATVQRLFPRTIPTGIAHGTLVIFERGQGYELTSFRVDGEYSDGRHPDQVTATDDIFEDLGRRDFTINAMAYDPLKELLHDPYGGQTDLDLGLIRTVGQPQQRFQEDALRMLRACRFAAQLGFEIATETAAAIPLLAAQIDKVSQPRISEEVSKLLLAPTVTKGLQALAQTGLLAHILAPFPILAPECVPPGISIEKSSAELELRLGLFLHSVLANLKDAPAALEQLRLSKRCTQKTLALLKQWPQVAELAATDWQANQLRRFLATVQQQHIPALFEMAVRLSPPATETRLGKLQHDCWQQVESGAAFSVAELRINGHQLCQHLKRAAGPWVGILLKQLLACVLEQPQLNSPEQLLQQAEAILKRSPPQSS